MPALVTPFTRDGDISEDGYKQVIDYTIDKGATGVVALGTTGEFSYLRTEERKKMLKLTIEYVDGRVPIIAGTGFNGSALHNAPHHRLGAMDGFSGRPDLTGFHCPAH